MAYGGQGAGAINEGYHGRCYAVIGRRFTGFGKALARFQHIGLDLAVGALNGEVAQILGGAKAAGYQ